MILDEGHRIKNRNCKLLRELKQIRTISRLLLTGTPIQNTLEELWSLLNFCSPQIFDNLEVFQSWFGFRNIGMYIIPFTPPFPLSSVLLVPTAHSRLLLLPSTSLSP